MKILFTGGGSGGHFYPIIAVAEQIEKIASNDKLLPPAFYLMAPEVSDERMLYDHNIEFLQVPAGKLRLYFSPMNFLDIFKTIAGCIKAFFKMFSIYPDVVFGKGGFGSFPALLSARILRIPIVIHESDSVPGRVNKWAGRFADRIAVSYPEAAEYFPKDRVAWTGQPVRFGIRKRQREEAEKFLKLEPHVPVMLILGGSLGAEKINDVVVDSLSELLPNWQIIHQTGRANLKDVTDRTKVTVADKNLLNRYHPFDFMTDSALAMASGAASLVISRAGSSIFEIASWGVPSIIIPILESNGDHQRANAYHYAQNGAAIVIEEMNLATHIFITEVEHIRGNDGLQKSMAEAAKAFHRADAGEKIARALVNIGISHGGK